MKGGVGKSTLATTLAIYLHDLGRRVAVIDTDKQLHAAHGVEKAEKSITIAPLFDVNAIPQRVEELAGSHDDVVADAPANLEGPGRALMAMANVAIFPTGATLKSLHSTKDSIEVLKWARAITGGRPEKAWLVLNGIETRTRLYREVLKLAPMLGISVASTPIRRLQAFPTADRDGTVVTRMNPDRPSVRRAQEDILGVFREIVNINQMEVANG